MSPAPNAAQASDELQRACEKALIELDHLRRKDKLTTEEVEAYKRQVKALEDLLATNEVIIAKYRKMTGEQDAVRTLDDKVVEEFKAMVKDYKSELERMTRSRNVWRTIAKVGTLTALAVGVVAGYLAGSR